MTYRDALKRVVATFVQAALAALLAAGAFDQDAATAALMAGLTAAVTLVHRLLSAYLES